MWVLLVSSLKNTFRDSSAVEQRSVKALVAGSNPAPGAQKNHLDLFSSINIFVTPAPDFSAF